MRYTAIFFSIIALSLAGILAGCKSDQTSASTGEGVINGYVVDGSSNARLAGVAVTAMTVSGSTLATTTDANGMYTFTFTVDSTLNVTVTMKKTGYRDTTVVAQLKSGVVSTQNFTLTPVSIVGGGTSGGTGLAQTIYFVGPQGAAVQVYGVGGQETIILSWEVRDSLGLPVDDSHAVNLNFSLTGGPNGGEYVSPVVLQTNASGQAHMTFNAGVKAGVVQVLATASVNGRTISSAPVKVIISGGYPDQTHFSIAVPKHNFPALDIMGMRLAVSVLVGDKYSNPAAPSAVYFSSTAGVVQGGMSGTVTTQDGEGAVDLISGNPPPIGVHAAPGYGDGYHFVTARTIGQGGVTVLDSTLVLWTGAGLITHISPSSFDIPNAGSQSITFEVSDVLGHPLAAGTTISVNASIPPPTTDGAKQNQVLVTFGNAGVIEMADVIVSGPGTTQFTCVLRDGTWDPSIDPGGTPVNLAFHVTGPNTPNGATATIYGVVH